MNVAAAKEKSAARALAPERAEPAPARPESLAGWEARVGAVAAAESISIDLVTNPACFAKLRREWGELLEDSSAQIFNAWEWLYPWFRRMGEGRDLRILTARGEGGKLLGLFPLAMQRFRAAGRTVRRLSFLGETEVGSDYLDIVARRGFEGPVVRAFAAELASVPGAWDVLELNEMDAASPTLALLLEALGKEFEIELKDRYVCPFEILSGEPFDTFLKRTGRRDNYLRRRKWLEKQPGYRIEKEEEPGRLQRPLSEFFRLHTLRWAEDGGSDGIRGAQSRAFHRDATELLAERGKLRMYTLMLGDRAVASVYAILHQGKFIYYQSGYDPEWRTRSVGLVLVGETFKDGLEAGLREYDFLHGTEAYKSDWTSQTRRTVTVRIRPRQGTGAWFSGVERSKGWARGVLKELLPEAAVERIRRWRRLWATR